MSAKPLNGTLQLGALDTIASTKLASSSDPVDTDFFPYYAGYSSGFVADVLSRLSLRMGSRILDPWNGSGTTTRIAFRAGLRAIGFDLNPAMIVVASAKLADARAASTSAGLARRLIGMTGTTIEFDRDPFDPLLTWFHPDTATRLRLLEQHICTLGAPHVRNVTALLYVALFRVVRSLLVQFRSSNPTWYRHADSPAARLHFGAREVHDRFLCYASDITRLVRLHATPQTLKQFKPRIGVARSAKLPLPDNSIDAILASPPYCTRLDYVKATLPELAVLRCRFPSGVNRLRSQMLGTPTIIAGQPAVAPPSGAALEFLGQVDQHPSKGSAHYYSPYFRQYFVGMWRSLAELRRVISEEGHCILVLQDSHYKEYRVPVATIVTELAAAAQWDVVDRHDGIVSVTRATSNGHSKAYRAASDTVETLLILRAQRQRRSSL